ncbi:precorrin-2 dehydrogenase/sirohydrochlorin ferrochelatase family protein [Halosegnis marinus]|uniref:precorrin-2 dehydrogenase n=1 Tax=Halosegnis marinus TaxID=3034023 RepID=A0ABD5ZL73_9EURY|nr:bifunctional precorrin-2 dehydrogenase/sirohydrochlorin ferrochelatase [Halosegnis sp. DT85]
MIPLLHDFAGETVLVFGGGPVGARKARRFAREARVVVVAPEFADADFGGAERVREAPAPDEVGGWLDRTDPALVVAATDDGALNARVESEARGRGVLVNRTDEHGGRDAGSVVVPATVRDGDVVVSISTGGASPALSKHLRERIESELADAGAMADLTGELRDRLQREGVAPEKRRAAVRSVVENDRVWKHLGEGASKAAQEADAVVDGVVGDDP